MKATEQKEALKTMVLAAQVTGQLLRKNLNAPKVIHQEMQHDIKLELDVRCQKLIERTLRGSFPDIPALGEEGITGDMEAPLRWVIDPIDGTVNFTYGIPHACVSIALQRRMKEARSRKSDGTSTTRGKYETLVGVVYDPFTDELWTAIKGQAARLNDKTIRVSARKNLEESIISVGFAKYAATLEQMLPTFNELVHRVRKIRIMGSAALAMVYVASGRFDAYIESGVRLWDIAAGGLILECAQGDFWNQAVDGEYTYRVLANNGLLRRSLQRIT